MSEVADETVSPSEEHVVPNESKSTTTMTSEKVEEEEDEKTHVATPTTTTFRRPPLPIATAALDQPSTNPFLAEGEKKRETAQNAHGVDVVVLSPRSGSSDAPPRLFGPRPVPPYLTMGDEGEEDLSSASSASSRTSTASSSTKRSLTKKAKQKKSAIASSATKPKGTARKSVTIKSPLRPAFRLSAALSPTKASASFASYFKDGFKRVATSTESPAAVRTQLTQQRDVLPASSSSSATTATAVPMGSPDTLSPTSSSNQLTEAEEIAMWTFWGDFIHDHETFLKKKAKKVASWITRGLPTPLRGLIWQLVSSSKDLDMETKFRELMQTEDCPFEKIIQRDLPRTFPHQPLFQEEGGLGQQQLLHITRAYSLFDPDVGYCQGLSFLAGILLLLMPEEEAFCVMVQWMHKYDLREHYTPKMDLLQARLYIWDRLLAEYCPLVSSHLAVEGIRSSMYASQWFLTLFAYRFPLELVFRILDLFFFEGVDVIFRVALVLMRQSETKMMAMEFETLLDYLKNQIHLPYQDCIDTLIKEAMDLKLSRKKLDKFLKDYRHLEAASSQQMQDSSPPTTANSQPSKTTQGGTTQEDQLHRQLSQAQTTILRQTLELKRLENTLSTLNREHVELANEMLRLQIVHKESGREQQQPSPLGVVPETQTAETDEHARILRRASLIAKSPYGHKSREHLAMRLSPSPPHLDVSLLPPHQEDGKTISPKTSDSPGTVTATKIDRKKWAQMEEQLQARDEALVHCKIQLAEAGTQIDQWRQQYREATKRIAELEAAAHKDDSANRDEDGETTSTMSKLASPTSATSLTSRWYRWRPSQATTKEEPQTDESASKNDLAAS